MIRNVKESGDGLAFSHHPNNSFPYLAKATEVEMQESHCRQFAPVVKFLIFSMIGHFPE